jgi:prepilin-type N-terminal cleavage/methylation domain-containing protein
MRLDRRGFTMIESLIVITAIGLLTAVAVPKIGRQIRSYRVGRATVVVAGDMENAFSMAARERKPLRLTLSGGTYTLADRTGGTTRLTRNLTADPDFGVASMTFSTSPLDVFPSGVASAADTVTLTNGTVSRQITVSKAGQVRVVR